MEPTQDTNANVCTNCHAEMKDGVCATCAATAPEATPTEETPAAE